MLLQDINESHGSSTTGMEEENNTCVDGIACSLNHKLCGHVLE